MICAVVAPYLSECLVYRQPTFSTLTSSCAAPAWCRNAVVRILFVACGLAAIQSLVSEDALASHCGSYVIANPDSSNGEKSSDTQLGTNSTPHLPTPCERGQCRQAPLSPLAPPTVPTVRVNDHLLLTVFAAIELSSKQDPDLWVTAARAQAGFYRQLEHPPDAQLSC